ncbi:MAG: hypothetical protein V7739_04405 [Motiliproteus sp.]
MRNNKTLLILVVLIIIAALVFYNKQRTDHLIDRLQAEGFRADQRLASDPIMLVDASQQQLAVIYPDRYLRLGFQQVIGIERALDVNHKDQEERLLQINLQGHKEKQVVIEGATPEQVVKWQQLLQQLVFNER